MFLEAQTTYIPEKVINIRLKKSTIEVNVVEVRAKRKGSKWEQQDEKKEEKKKSTEHIVCDMALIYIFSYNLHSIPE